MRTSYENYFPGVAVSYKPRFSDAPQSHRVHDDGLMLTTVYYGSDVYLCVLAHIKTNDEKCHTEIAGSCAIDFLLCLIDKCVFPSAIKCNKTFPNRHHTRVTRCCPKNINNHLCLHYRKCSSLLVTSIFIDSPQCIYQ